MQSTDWKLFSRFLEFVKPHRIWVFFSIGAIPFSTAATILVPYLIVRIIDDYIIPGNTSGLYLMTAILAGAVFMSYLADGVYTFTLQKAGQMTIARLRKALLDHTLNLPRTYFDNNPIGATLSRMTSDIEAVGESLAVGVLALFTDVIKALALFVFLFYLSWKLTLAIVLLLPIVYIIITVLRKKLRRYFNEARESLAQATAFLQECLTGMKTIQLFVAEKNVHQQFKQKNSQFLKSQTKANGYDAALFSIIEGVTSVAMALIIWYGTGQILAGVITIGILVGFINTLSRLFIPIREFAQQIAVIQRALAALEHVSQLFAEPEEEELLLQAEFTLDQPVPDFVDIRFENVSFSYSEKGLQALDNVSFSVNKGEKVAVVGETGAGKSTILKILSKTYERYQGSIKLNGRELREIPKSELMRTLTMMQQDVFLLDESLAFNISLDRPEISQERVQKAIQFVHADEFIDQLPGKLNYRIVENGSNLSSGQAQLISFARAIASDCDLILLDEATSSVDTVTEHLIQKATEKIFQEKSVIAIAHRLSTIRHSDMILVMKNGKIVEQGNHETLVGKEGYYLQLLNRMESETT